MSDYNRCSSCGRTADECDELKPRFQLCCDMCSHIVSSREENNEFSGEDLSHTFDQRMSLRAVFGFLGVRIPEYSINKKFFGLQGRTFGDGDGGI